tara:strand:- start:31 stop:648 length:618 start_codon:yes stop_codon:yes gene_type:complete
MNNANNNKMSTQNTQNTQNQAVMTNNVKIQKRKVGVAGGFFNQMMGNNASIPVVGEGATILHYSDRSAYEVIEVSNDGMTCVIREMETKNIGSGYGDERYEYKSNIENSTKNLEWNEKKGQWQSYGFSVQIIKSLWKKLSTEFGQWNVWENLPNGLISSDLYNKEFEDDYYNTMKLIKGVTKSYKNTSKVSIIFGTMEQYRDPSF